MELFLQANTTRERSRMSTVYGLFKALALFEFCACETVLSKFKKLLFLNLIEISITSNSNNSSIFISMV